jgi:hypothetical protein
MDSSPLSLNDCLKIHVDTCVVDYADGGYFCYWLCFNYVDVYGSVDSRLTPLQVIKEFPQNIGNLSNIFCVAWKEYVFYMP